MYKMFDYIFFRIYDHYRKKESDIPVDRGIQFLSITQLFMIFGILLVVDYCTGVIQQLNTNKFILGLPVALLVMVVNEIRYKRMAKKNDFGPFYQRWENEAPAVRKRNMILLVMLPVLLLFGIPLVLWAISKL
ncbi:MAG: hypothetical protein P0Y53_15815 [Candidatus Pseudobacter hemicellulosilyticus]|uniref:Uncharacterized protein n=1 Tax=Candidatus Pseudobacter hemicellulosilyticus TaxID=3121375 RepID=A0AAJ5WNN8_9BACT|nr:MAG: hypothetical protein P0Y53_15815 [Pseudobacter sp.]